MKSTEHQADHYAFRERRKRVEVSMVASGDRAPIPWHDAQQVRHSGSACHACEYQTGADERRQSEKDRGEE
ncbi:hypothetical protein HHL08_23960 [Sphingobium sp. AR-3-1]|uniref:Uncharacterized protein n=1 Tax=Sphingobium psychrophilum TaxID=2728834 RepID=A0A7X9X072_9SPHN|nr:hypothetical protein [Sphingobium psychrophilum]NML13143.1 hypothetical protein [Sphingobium psychrophilum]